MIKVLGKCIVQRVLKQEKKTFTTGCTTYKTYKEELPDLIKLSQIALTLPLHTASSERVFSLTKQRSRLAPATSDKLLRTRLASNAGVIFHYNNNNC